MSRSALPRTRCGRRTRPALALAAALAAGACQGPLAPRPAPDILPVPIPDAWSTPGHAAALAAGWLAELGSSPLAALVDEALANNPDLRTAAARLDAALGEVALAGAAEGVSADLALAASRGGSATGGIRRTANSFRGALDVRWEADVWRRLRASTEAAGLDVTASQADVDAARLSLAANVARAWFDALVAERQLALAAETVSNFESNLAVVEETFRSGLGSALDVRLERSNLAGAQARRASRTVVRERAVRALEILLGRYPDGTLRVSGEFPDVGAAIPAGLPASLLERRPDIRAAALRIRGADRRIEAARKARLPGISLTGSAGLGSNELRSLLDFDAIVWSLAASIVSPVLDAGRIDAQVAIARARADERVAAYVATVLTAFQEVESALAAESHLGQQERALARAALESEEAATLALERYRAGLVDIITWLEARRRAFDARSSRLDIANARVQNRITLHLALAGDFGLGRAPASAR